MLIVGACNSFNCISEGRQGIASRKNWPGGSESAGGVRCQCFEIFSKDLSPVDSQPSMGRGYNDMCITMRT